MNNRPAPTFGHSYQTGFTLVEMAMVLMIVGLLLGGLIPTISSQMERQHSNETRKQMDEIQQALIGFAIINGRLPCPASSTSNGVESPTTGTGICDHSYDGYVPAATLGVTSAVDSQGNKGFAVDSWGNRIRYVATSSNSNAFTKPNGMSTTGISALAPNLLVCSTATGITISSCAAGTSLTSNGVPVVIFSTGKNGAQGSAGTDEAANLDGTNANNNRTFVSHTPSPSTAANGEFDDIVIWLSPNTLLNRMVAAGKLP